MNTAPTDSTKFALITGASAGLGAEFARLCAADGYNLILVARRLGPMQKLADQLTAEFKITCVLHSVDLTNSTSTQKFVENLHEQDLNEKIKVFINNAGYGKVGAF